METHYDTVCGFLSAEVIFKVSDVTYLTRCHVFMLHEPYADIIGLTIRKLSIRKNAV